MFLLVKYRTAVIKHAELLIFSIMRQTIKNIPVKLKIVCTSGGCEHFKISCLKKWNLIDKGMLDNVF